MAIGFWTSGSAAKTETRNPAGTRKPAAASVAGERLRVVDGSVSRGAGKSSPAGRVHRDDRDRHRNAKYDNVVGSCLARERSAD